MAERNALLAPLVGSNYATWKVHCTMALKKEGLWKITEGSETDPGSDDADKQAKFLERKDRALAIIVLAVHPSLLYLLGDPQDPKIVWEKIANQFQKKSWANKYALRKRLNSLKLKEKGSVQQHIKEMMEVFEELSIIGHPIEEEDRVVTLLTSLPKSYDMLVTALEANTEVPKLETVTERLLHEERKLIEKGEGKSESHDARAFAVMRNQGAGTGRTCFYCGEQGHIKRNCPKLKEVIEQKKKRSKETVNVAEKSIAKSG